MLRASEVAEEYPVEGLQVFTDTGWHDIKKVYKTVPLPVWLLYTKEGFSLKCSHEHLVVTAYVGGDAESEPEHVLKKACEVKEGDTLVTEHGADVVVESSDTGRTEELYDLTVDSEEGLFFSNGILSHNSTTLAARLILSLYLIPGYSALYVAPYFDQMKTFAKRLREMEHVFRGDLGDPNLYAKMYPNRSQTALMYALTGAERVRGMSNDLIVIDECVGRDEILLRRNDGVDSEVPIHRVNVGDTVKCFDTGNNVVYGEVTAKACKGIRRCLKLVTVSGKTLTATGNHKVRVPSGWVYMDSIASGTTVGGHSSSGEFVWEDVVAVEDAGEQEVWDITVDNHNTFFANSIAVHNCQNMDPEIIPEILYTQAMSRLPTTLYTGTALTVDTLLQQKWEESSQGVWMQRAGDGSWLAMNDVETLMAVCDNPTGPKCPKTGKILDVRDGFFEHTNQKALATSHIGYHVPQCIIPDVAYRPTQWLTLYQHIKRDTQSKIMQECFGIAVEEGTREITQQDLMRLCVLQDNVEALKEKCRNGYYRCVISGCDWGGSDYNPAEKTKVSYTVHCIIGVAPDNKVDILHYRRYSGMDYADVADSIVQEHYAFNGRCIASDFGVGMAYNMLIRQRIPFDCHFVMGYVGPKAAPLSEPKDAHMANQLSLNRTEALTNVFRDVKDHMGKIRARRWEEMETYLMDWLAMYRIPAENSIGATTFKYIRAATKPDDALHAFTFAYTMALLFMGIPLVRDEALDQRLRNVLHGGNTSILRATGGTGPGRTVYAISG